MDIPSDPHSQAILQLEAQVHALKFMLALVYADNPIALNRLKTYIPIAEDFMSQFAVTEEQIALYKAEMQILAGNVEIYVRGELDRERNASERDSGEG